MQAYSRGDVENIHRFSLVQAQEAFLARGGGGSAKAAGGSAAAQGQQKGKIQEQAFTLFKQVGSGEGAEWAGPGTGAHAVRGWGSGQTHYNAPSQDVFDRPPLD